MKSKAACSQTASVKLFLPLFTGATSREGANVSGRNRLTVVLAQRGLKKNKKNPIYVCGHNGKLHLFLFLRQPDSWTIKAVHFPDDKEGISLKM